MRSASLICRQKKWKHTKNSPGEAEADTEWKVANTFEEFLEQADLCGAEYYYIMKDGVWYVGTTYETGPLSKSLVLLSEALESATETVDQ
jgi:hypothetical protein